MQHCDLGRFVLLVGTNGIVDGLFLNLEKLDVMLQILYYQLFAHSFGNLYLISLL